jgi:hypothetical protein
VALFSPEIEAHPSLPKKIGRRKGTRNKGFFFRSGRGWYTKRDGQFIPLLDEDGARLKDKDTLERFIREAWARVVLNVRAQPVIKQQASSDWKLDAPVGEVCAAYLAFLRTGAGDIGRQPTARRRRTSIGARRSSIFATVFPASSFATATRQSARRKEVRRANVCTHDSDALVLRDAAWPCR